MPVTLTVDTDGVAHLTLDRPAKRNALDRAMVAALREQVAVLAARDDVRVVVLRGAGGSFCAGADIADWVAPANAVAAAQSRAGTAAFDAIAALPVPTVAVLEGIAVGGGLELAMACDLRIASRDARLGLPELGLGNLPSWGGTARIADVAGLGVARHLLLSGELITGVRAAELLIVSSAHEAADLDTAVAALVQRLTQAEPLAVSLAKRALAGLERHLAQEDALAAYTAGLDSSRDRKQDFLDRKAAAKKATAARAASSTSEGTAS
ncbi:enoyl-CoA hydratase/isomerase family protein [Nocardioides sp. BYT-33-1]|jgi:enoyl-CoA hydratase/carnithine racemase|uniref:enoyl-CoA hydratase/isomerase family protein n=1 Tax=Nocardioides sp. BYT-33-1 TaxID=3416952 RepID=UPI003F5322C1